MQAMTEKAIPWYVRIVIGLAAWITAVVLTLLAGTTVFGLMNIENLVVVAVIGLMYLGVGRLLIKKPQASIFREQLGLAAALAGAATVSISLSVEFKSMWLGLLVAIGILGAVEMTTRDTILRFLTALLVAGFYMAALIKENFGYNLGLIALTTPLGLYLLMRQQSRDLTPIAIAFFLAYPLASVALTDVGLLIRGESMTGDILVKGLHIALFLWLLFFNWSEIKDSGSWQNIIGFSIVATLVCLLLPPGGSAAMLILTFAYVVGSMPFAILGLALEAQFITRYYYSLEMNLLNKSLLLMAVGLLLAAYMVADKSQV